MISPEIWESEDFKELNVFSRLLFIGMFSLADDYGKGKANASLLKSKIFPYDDDVRTTDIEKSLQEIAANMSVYIYLACDGNTYYQFYHWSIWQRVDRPSISRIPDYSEEHSRLLGEDSSNVRRNVGEGSGKVRGSLPPNKNKNIKEKENTSYSCTEPADSEQEQSMQKSPKTEECVITLTLNGGGEYEVTKELFDYFKETYPHLDLMQELRSMKAWLDTNVAKRKTERGMRRFINGWLQKSQNRGNGKQQAAAKPKNAFNNFPQRDYDMESLEKELLNSK